MAPFDPEDPTSGFDDQEKEQSSLVRPSDVTRYAHGAPGLPGGYNNQVLTLDGQQAVAEHNAMLDLQKAMNKQPYISPSQGIAAALLAAIPTLGGYMLGKTVNTPKIPPGVFGVDMNKNPSGANFGGELGAKTGEDAATQYFKTLQDNQDQANAINVKEAQIEQQKAERLQGEKAQLVQAGLGKQEERDLIPVRANEEIRAQKAILGFKEGMEALPADAEKRSNEALGIPADSHMSPSARRVLTASVEAGRKQEQGDIRLRGEAVNPPSEATKQKIDSVIATKAIGQRYISKLQNIAESNPSWVERNISAVLPATEIGELQKNLSLFAVQVRNARENGVMTEPDFQRYMEYLTIGKLDTLGSVLKRMGELQTVTDLSAMSTLQVAKAGRENISGFEKLLGITIPDYLSSPGAQKAPAGSATPNPVPQPQSNVSDPLGIR